MNSYIKDWYKCLASAQKMLEISTRVISTKWIGELQVNNAK